MYVVEIGNIASVHGNDPQLPETGIIIKATKEELMKLPPLLYKEIKEIVTDKAAKRTKDGEDGTADDGAEVRTVEGGADGDS